MNNKQNSKIQLNKVQQERLKNKIKLKLFLAIKLIKLTKLTKLTRWSLNKKIKVGG